MEGGQWRTSHSPVAGTLAIDWLLKSQSLRYRGPRAAPQDVRLTLLTGQLCGHPRVPNSTGYLWDKMEIRANCGTGPYKVGVP